MQMHLDTLYVIRTLFCESNELDSFEFWKKIMDIIAPITAQTNYKGNVIPSIYDKQKKDWITFEGVLWKKSDLGKWTAKKNHHNVNLEFDSVEIFFPDMQQCNAEKITPDIIIKASVKAAEDEKRYESLLSLFIKEELLHQVPSAQAENAFDSLNDYLSPLFIAGTTRPWAIKKAELEYGESLHYFFPSVVLANDDKFVFRAGYEGWQQL
jgi:hypothetical protein